MNHEELNRESLIIHIKGLQQTLTERNEKITRLEAKLNAPEIINDAAVKKAYKRGWQDAASSMMELSMDAARSLRKIRGEAWAVYLEGEHK